ncbi:hypothetical protein L798_07836 [Zootermopsis nevadensis]|uniref:Uncharacterized protein n=1 Tax=Zootermopsis nevadensis TaxID=136037 RepID=A0A067RER4_ZOONE|nr:hypothetical protein L798_07836 [Zootermopsis nevadensis]
MEEYKVNGSLLNNEQYCHTTSEGPTGSLKMKANAALVKFAGPASKQMIVTGYWERPILLVPEHCGPQLFVGSIYRHSVGLLGPSQGLYLYTGQHNREKCRQTSMA